MRTLIVYLSKFGNTQQPGEVDLRFEGEIERARQWAIEIIGKSAKAVSER